ASVTLHHPESAHPCTLSLHDALPICARFSFRPMSNTMTAPPQSRALEARAPKMVAYWVLLTIFLVVDVVTKQIAERTLLLHQPRSEEHTSELQSRENLVCRLLLEKKK